MKVLGASHCHANISNTQSGEKHVQLHGCVHCDNKVWGPDDVEDICNLCGCNRYDDNGKPKEYVIHFPLTERLQSLLCCKQYYDSVRWECDRSRTNDDYMTG
jgi:hypothetical protein